MPTRAGTGPGRTILVVAAVVLLGAACGGGTGSAPGALPSFFEAVQDRDFDGLYCMMAGASSAEELGATPAERRANFESWAEAFYEAYERDRDEGWVDLDEQGLSLVKLFALGRGTFVSHRVVASPGAGAAVVESEVRFGYAHIDLSRFSPGTTLYACGAPVGRVHPIRIPAGSREITVELLERATVRWTLVETEPTAECAGGWAVAAGEPVEGTEATTTVTWMF